jgi:hypothetical protein
MGLTGGVHASVGWERTVSGLRESGPWAGFFSGPNRSPEVQIPIFILFTSFLFSVFPFSFYSDFSLSFEEFLLFRFEGK